MNIQEPCLPPTMRRVRGILAEHKITRARFAAACGLSTQHVSVLLFEHLKPGELAAIKLRAGLESLGLIDERGRERSLPASARGRRTTR